LVNLLYLMVKFGENIATMPKLVSGQARTLNWALYLVALSNS